MYKHVSLLTGLTAVFFLVRVSWFLIWPVLHLMARMHGGPERGHKRLLVNHDFIIEDQPLIDLKDQSSLEGFLQGKMGLLKIEYKMRGRNLDIEI